MKNYINKILILCLALFLVGFTPPDRQGDITDTSNRISSEQDRLLEAKTDTVNKKSNNTITVLVLNSISDDNIDDVAYDTFKAWGIGDAKLDNGVLLAIAVNERKIRIETGKGVEGDLTDAESIRIIREVMVPHLKKGSEDYYKAIDVGIDAISAELENKTHLASATTNKDSGAFSDNSGGFVIFLVVVFGFILLMWIIFSKKYGSSHRYGSSYSGGSYRSSSGSSSYSSGSSSSSSGGGSYGGGSSGGGGASSDY